MSDTGHKFDAGKNDLRLIMPGYLWETGLVLTHGANLHGPYNWEKVEPERYVSALDRHWLQYKMGQKYDPDTGLHHLAHLNCCSMFLWWFDEGGIPHDRCYCPHCQPTPALVS